MNTNANGTQVQGLTMAEITGLLANVRPATDTTVGRVEDGTRVHVQYKAFGTPTAQAIAEAQRANDLGLALDRYTGRVSRIWKSKAGDTILTLYVELERDHTYRSLNLNKGTVQKLVVLGN